MSELLEQNYANVYDNKLGFGERPALLLVDFVQAYFDPDCDLYANVDEALQSALRVLEAARAASIPIIFTRVMYQAKGLDGGVFFKKAKPLRHFLEGSPLGNWPTGLSPGENEIVLTKQYPSAFFGTSLASTLTAANVDSVILTGLTTSGCIRATCVDACSHGFLPLVVEQACGDRHSAPHQANLFDMNAKYADVVQEAEILQYLQTFQSSKK